MTQSAPNPPAPSVKDVPRAGFTCGSYEPGHNVHYASALKRAPGLTPLSALLGHHDEGITLTASESVMRIWTHNEAAIWMLIEEVAARCAWYPTLGLACWITPDVRHWANLSLEPVTACFSTDEARRAEWRHWN